MNPTQHCSLQKGLEKIQIVLRNRVLIFDSYSYIKINAPRTKDTNGAHDFLIPLFFSFHFREPFFRQVFRNTESNLRAV